MVAAVTVGFVLIKGPKENEPLPQGFELPKYSEDEDIVHHVGYTASYNHGTLCPDWVAWELTKEEANATMNGQYSFSRDPDVRFPKASREDYSNTGWDKGHMAPRADMRWSLKALEESYYFTNICPQDHAMNAGAWRRIEELTRGLANRYGRVYVVCGPIYTTYSHGTIGAANVMVPDKFFKVLAVSTEEGVQTVGFIVENNSQLKAPQHYAVAVDSVESVIRRNLFPQAPEKAEASFDWKVWK